VATVKGYAEHEKEVFESVLQGELAGTENRIAVERKRFNDVVLGFNQTIVTFPNSALGFGVKEYFQADATAQRVPDVKF